MKTLCIVLLALGDLIFLKDGRTVEGVYVGEDEVSVRYRVASGQVLSEPKSSIARVERVCTKTNVYEAVASTLTAERPAEYFYLCAWAEEQGLKPPAENLCRVAVSDEELKGTALLRLSRAAAGQGAYGLLRSAVVASPELTGAVAALRSAPGKKVELPESFLSAFTSALDSTVEGSYTLALSMAKLALGRLDPAQRRALDAVFKPRTRMTTDAYLSRLQALGGRHGECPHCHSTGLLACLECNGRGWKPCPSCQGKGYGKVLLLGLGPHDKLRECATCRGSGRIHCKVCIPLERAIRRSVLVRLPRPLQEQDYMPHAWQYGRWPTTAGGGASGKRPGSGSPVVIVHFATKSSGKRKCPHCAREEKGRGKRFTASELAELAELARLWRDALKSPGGGWRTKARISGLGELYAALRFRPERATAFCEGRWITPETRRMHHPAERHAVTEADTSAFEEWKTGYRCRMLSEQAIPIAAEPSAWLGLFRLYLHAGKTEPGRRFASRQVYCASFSSRAREASLLSPRGELVAVAGKEGLVLQPDRALDTGGAERVDLWFRVFDATEDPAPVLAVQVLAARWGEKTVAFF